MTTRHEESGQGGIDPETAVREYLHTRQEENLSDATVRTHEYRLSHFARWCAEVECAGDLCQLTAAKLSAYATWRQRDSDLSRTGPHTRLSTRKVFVRWAGSEGYVPETLYEAVRPLALREREGVSRTYLRVEDAEATLGWLARFDYASARHVHMLLLWVTGRRVGGVRGLDAADCDRWRTVCSFATDPGPRYTPEDERAR